jgi:hypothetical protein
MSSKSSYVAAVLVGSAVILGGCGTGAEENTTNTDTQTSFATTDQHITSGWTAFTSEEYPPITCDSSSLVSGVQCTGSNCDNIRFLCTPTAGVRGTSYWTSYFSEEGTNWRYCNAGSWVTGIACNGDDCDNISLQCSYMSNISQRNCYWTGWMSEENGGYLYFGTNYFINGVQCDGDDCDNKRYYVCQP